ncbi:MAG: lamin tail domain-containing protein, partial [Myxococcales bacterium]
EGVTGSALPEPLFVRFDATQANDVGVQLASADPALVVPASVTVPAGTLTAEVPLTGVAQHAGVVLTATVGASSRAATVRVLGASEQPKLASFKLSSATVAPGGSVTATVLLDVPAFAPTTVDLAVAPANGFGSLPATLTIAANALGGSFTFTADPAAQGPGTLEATLGADTLAAPLTVATPGVNHVLISELGVAGAGTGTAGDEFVELYNPTASAIDLSGYKVQYKSATGTTFATVATLPAGSTIGAYGYFLLTAAPGTYTGSVAGDWAHASAFNFAAAVGHVRIGTSAVGTGKTDPNAVDTVAYGSTADSAEGNAPAPVPVSGSGTAGSIERKAKASSTSASMAANGADALLGNGYDSNRNAQDFVTRQTRDPQNRASPAEVP